MLGTPERERRRFVRGLQVVLALLLGACAGNAADDPRANPPLADATPAAGGAPTTSTTAPPADEVDAEAVFLELMTARANAYELPSIDSLANVYWPGDFFDFELPYVMELEEARHRYTDIGVRFSQISVTERRPPDEVVVEVNRRAIATTIVDEGGAVVRTEAAEPAEVLRYVLQRRRGAWRIYSVGVPPG